MESFTLALPVFKQNEFKHKDFKHNKFQKDFLFIKKELLSFRTKISNGGQVKVLDFKPSFFSGANSLDEVHGNFNWKSFGALLLIWLLIYACIFKGIRIVSHVVKVTATVPVIIIIILAIMGKYQKLFYNFFTIETKYVSKQIVHFIFYKTDSAFF